ncbi:energy transducer TonB [Tenacibaculum tangerinum]|uniref:Energy transducer TonB n=1 Tax=Tenacibaculum tangerinum TaxID=3038772 RepID=A0ABY8L436_9FLAO|nr:energy transducer TonB [Tenacibaculum tangerinum]WGH75856.1 energy transducer TonB [Tenacibaculum tangerinum]
MKKLFLLLFLSSFCFSQTAKDQFYDEFTNPNINNKLSNYLKENLHKDLLKDITYPEKSKKIILSFQINKENIPYRIDINSSRNRELIKSLKKLFKEYNLNNFTTKFDTRKKYSLQIITPNGISNIINCSTIPLEISSPNYKSCEDLDFYDDIKYCVNKNIKNHFYNSINYDLADSILTNEEGVTLDFKVLIDKHGKLKLTEIEAPEVFKKNIAKITEKYDTVFLPKMINNKPTNYYYHIKQVFEKGEKPISDLELDYNFDSIFKTNSTNELANYFKKNLSPEDLEKANLNRVHDRLKLYFELDVTGKPFKVSTNSRSDLLERKIINIFKRYDLSKSTFKNTHPINRYFTTVIKHENGVNKVVTNSIMGYSRIPVFPNCENSLNATMGKNCYNRTISQFFVKHFNSNLAAKLGLMPGKKIIYVKFTIDKDGKVTNVSCRAPHPKLKEESIRVIKKLTKATPAMFGDKPAKVSYTLPVTFNVE